MYHKRNLVTVDASQCVVSGDGLGPTIEAFKSYTINLVAKDFSGSNIGVGGEYFKINIVNRWTISGVLSCTVDASAKMPLESSISGYMTDNGDGTYHYNYTINQSGAITILISLETAGVYGEFRPTYEIVGPVVSTNISSRVYFETGDIIVNGESEYVSSIFTTSLLAPATGNYYFQFDYDDGLQIEFEGDIKFAALDVISEITSNFTASLVGGQYYQLKVWLQNAWGPGGVKAYWTVPFSTYTDIPSSAYYYKRYVGSTPYQVSVTCPTGYSGTNLAYPYICKEICGDGIRVGSEIWDDSNTLDGDDWIGAWTSAESRYICVGGNSTSADTCTEWADGYYPNTNSPPDVWNTKWGDGKKVLGVESWEDGNMIDGDGWSSICLQEIDWTWFGGNINRTDSWFKWKAGYTATQNYELWFETPLSENTQIMRAFAAFFVITGISMSSTIALVSSSSSTSSSFGLINQLQMIMLLPILDSYIPDKILDFIKSMRDSLFNIEFLSTDGLTFLDPFNEKFDFFQYNLYLYLLGLESGSAIVNVINSLIMSFFIIVGHSILFAIYLVMAKNSVLLKINSYLRKFLSVMTFGFYVTLINEVYLLLVIAVIYEISNNDSKSTKEYNSLIMTRIMLGLICWYLVFVLWQWIKSFSPTRFRRMKYFKALFQGLKDNKWARAFPLLSLLKKMLFWIVLFRFTGWDFDDKIGTFLAVELTYLVLIGILRPYVLKVDMFIEFMNEVFYVYFIAYLWGFKTKESWGTSSTDAFFWMMIANNMLIVIISNCVQILIIVKIIKTKCVNKNKVNEKHKNEFRADTRYIIMLRLL
jgi:hypothetical protein